MPNFRSVDQLFRFARLPKVCGHTYIHTYIHSEILAQLKLRIGLFHHTELKKNIWRQLFRFNDVKWAQNTVKMGITREKNGNLKKWKKHPGVFTLGARTPNFSSVDQLFCSLGLPKVRGHHIHTFWNSSSTEVENIFDLSKFIRINRQL